jgi:hypothetical protein
VSNKPIATIRSCAAPGVSCSIWGGTTEGHFNLKFQKSYKDKSGQWKNTDYLSPADAAGIPHLLPQVFAYCDRIKGQSKKTEIGKLSEDENKKIEERFNLPPKDEEQPPPFDDDDIPF